MTSLTLLLPQTSGVAQRMTTLASGPSTGSMPLRTVHFSPSLFSQVVDSASCLSDETTTTTATATTTTTTTTKALGQPSSMSKAGEGCLMHADADWLKLIC